MSRLPIAIAKALQRFENACDNAWESDGRDVSEGLSRKLHDKADVAKEALVTAILESIGNFTPSKEVVLAALMNPESLDKCETCGGKNIIQNGCLRCGAPICCDDCCIKTTSELAALLWPNLHKDKSV